ncbi:class I mannose-6-phosphate isomerase [Paenibacillus ginsengarvi]|uniref:Phosphohexomutase n=1 Tax=Paenibacillus ginsengarvi TaxID=400777 RepID=A0A3B0CKX7_9BACL|nr:type I phosphomannose isomerase catalytic subunit [Paenibacillus ginsengarvi]RKN84889.1 mannose-6-phosphate isomerase [Paenibacillus ginsengarvi]
MNDANKSLSQIPLRLIDDRVWRTYRGGLGLEAWRRQHDPRDSDYPELWVASTVQAVNAGREHAAAEGLSQVALPGSPDGTAVTLKELIESDPARFLGAEHARRYESSPALLVKVLDSCERLTIQVHPDPDFALEAFDSRFGKTEAWYVLGGRTIDGEPPYVLLGFKPHVTKELWRRLFEEQDIPAMLDALHKVEVREGDVFLIAGGLPHAIGSGCLLIEIQEPTDLTLRTERTTPRGVRLPDRACHQGIGFDRMLDCFHYEAACLTDTLFRTKIVPEVADHQDGGTETFLIQPKHTERFRMNRLQVTGQYEMAKQDEFAVAIVVAGSGTLLFASGEAALGTGDTLFLPAGLRHMTWRANDPREALVVVLCYPPK